MRLNCLTFASEKEIRRKNQTRFKLNAPDSDKYVYPCTTGYNLEFVNSLNDQWGVVEWTSSTQASFQIHILNRGLD